jgi:hypothetical protein
MLAFVRIDVAHLLPHFSSAGKPHGSGSTWGFLPKHLLWPKEF